MNYYIELFDKDERYTSVGTCLANEATSTIATLFKQYIDMGCCIREISHIIMGAVKEEELSNILRNQD